MNFNLYFFTGKIMVLMLAFIVMPIKSSGQTHEIPLDDLSAFQDPEKSWQIAGNVYSELDKINEFKITKGKGILVNNFRGGGVRDLLTKEEHGNIDLKLDFLMARGSNSGIYFMGQYELQLNDSWGVTSVTSGENGAIYERWDESRPQGQKGYQGYPPRQNVSRAPGLWQHLEVSFQAPKFNKDGKKIENARFIYVKLNGVTIHENVELFGSTRGSMISGEKSAGPLRLQGDHGAVAFRNIEMTKFDKPRPELKQLEYQIYRGKFENEPNYDNLPPEFEGKSALLTSNLRVKSGQFLIRYTGELNVKETGEYTFNLKVAGGEGLLRINDNEVISLSGGGGTGSLNLPAGELPFELIYSKFQDWVEPGLGLSVSGVGIRRYLISDATGDFEEPVNPILLEANEPTVFRSFMDIPGGEEKGGQRLTHSVSVGNPRQLHYTYDLSKGSIVQLWRGGFLDVTPMWYSRGNGTSRPIGSILHLGEPEITVGKLSSAQQVWARDTTGTDYRSLGYRLDANDLPTFLYSIYGNEIEDKPRVLENGRGVQRTISIDAPVQNLYVKLVKGKNVEKVSKDLFVIGDKDFYIRFDNSNKTKPILRSNNGEQELLVPLQKELIYTLLF